MAEFVGFGAHKLEMKPWATRPEWIVRSRAMLSRVINLHTTVAFLGSGCSVPLGYPSWKQFAAEVAARTIEEITARPVRAEVKAQLQRLNRFQAQLSGDQQIKSDQLLFILGVCQKLFQQCEATPAYQEILGTLFQPRKAETDALNPYHALLDLQHVQRFITSNYDCEIERALHFKRRVSKSELGLIEGGAQPFVEKQRSFTQQHYDPLALFVMARVQDAVNMVFHCHGSYQDPPSMIVTESDYQRWYLSDQGGAGVAFRQTLDLLFGSNPILFVGFGLGDDDLMRPLRAFVAADQDREDKRPLFALLPEEEEGRDWDYHQQLYDRYGVNVIPYTRPSVTDKQLWGRALCDALARVKQDWLAWREGWLQKPVIRRVSVSVKPPRAYRHYEPEPEALTPNTKRDKKILGELKRAAENGARVIALVGPGGTGKSWYAMKLLQTLERRSRRFKGFFFWSSYYADDSLTGLDRALGYLAKERRRRRPRLERFSECLKQGRYFLIFDGVERFLRESEIPDEGAAYTPGIDELLKVMADPRNKSTIVLTSRLWPQGLGPPDESIQLQHIPRFSTDDLLEIEPFNALPRLEVSALCSLLDGHIFGLILAARLLQQDGLERLPELRRALSDTPPDRRVSRMIREAIEAADKYCDGLALKLLERLAIFMSPVTEWTIKHCYDLAVESMGGDCPHSPELLYQTLLKRQLLHRVKYGEKSTDYSSYSVHPLIRGYVFQRIHHAATDALPNFMLPGFTAGTAIVDPGSRESAEVVTGVFNRLYEKAEQAIKDRREQEGRVLSRAAFGVVRSRMESNTVARWCSYDEYLRYVLRLGNLTKRAAPRFWDYASRHDLRDVEDTDGPLYADELAWLYNEIGLTCYSQSAMMDALAVWEQGYEVNRIIDSLDEGGLYLFQSQCNLGAANIQFGRLNVAQEHLRNAERTNFLPNDPDHAGRLTGYQALIQHLHGNLTEAERLYQKSLELLKQAGGNPRAESIFYRHYCDLQIRLGKMEEAARLMQTSRSLAESAYYPDLVAYVRLPYGHWYRAQKKFAQALREYNIALSESRRIGIRRLEAEALSELSRLALDLGDAQIARQRAIESLRIANECVLGLRQTHSLIVLGRASIKAGQHEIGVAYLKHARTLAARQQYWIRGREAEEELHQLGEA